MSYLREKILDWLHTTLQHYSRTENTEAIPTRESRKENMS